MQFRTKARAVDLLGKGQIADLPTAITELWKNGYDAYADKLEARIYLEGYKDLKHPMFVITDDGKGMSQQEIFDKWLVLGTDSKSRNELEKKESLETLWKKPRIKAGEKGIGRLSVAFLGSPMLMLTKKRGHSLQALFFDWRLLENYNLFLDDIEIPVQEIESRNEFRSKFEKLKKEFLKNFKKEKDSDGNSIWEKKQKKLKETIINSVEGISLPDFFEEELLNDIVSYTNENGTKFIVFEPIEQIINLTKPKDDDINDNEVVISSLSGFTNAFKENNKLINTFIPVFSSDGNKYDLLNEKGGFFTNKDFSLADIVIDGTFDGSGSFRGILTVYDEEFSYSYNNPRKKIKGTNYGTFPLKLGYSLGNEVDSKLEKGLYNSLKKRLKIFGGLYLYRDEFRVLPYGRVSYDFLDFEERRSKHAGNHFFSHRRMFGYIGLTRKTNEHLKDKASREGLINNSYYRAFRNDLIQFFKELADEYFATSPKKTIFIDKKEQFQNQKKAIQQDKDREKKEKIVFSKLLKQYPEKFEAYQKEYKSTIASLKEKVDYKQVIYSELESNLERIKQLNIEYKELLPEIPKRYEPTETQLDRLHAYGDILVEFHETVKKESKNLLKKVKSRLAVRDLKREFENNFLTYGGALEKQINGKKEELVSKLDSIEKEYKERAKRIIDELYFEKNKISDRIQSREDIIDGIETISDKFEYLREQVDRELVPIVDHIKRLDFDIDEELVQGAYKAEYETIKYQWEQTRDVAQIGIAVEIIDHEFNQLYAKINHSLDKLKENGDCKASLDFEFLYKNFKQLEDKYDLLSPLYRVSGVITREIKCSSILEYLNRFFSARLEDEKIKLIATSVFKKHTIKIKEPIIHTVFINLIINAIYWLRNSETKIIELDYLSKTKEIIVRNSGAKIEKHRLEKIFELFYSNRPNGRGIGLYLSRQSLNDNYFEIYATNDDKYNKLNGACFVIKPSK